MNREDKAAEVLKKTIKIWNSVHHDEVYRKERKNKEVGNDLRVLHRSVRLKVVKFA